MIILGGVVDYGEDYDIGAKRELEEELGIKDTNLEKLFKLYFENDEARIWGTAYFVLYDKLDIKK